MSAPPSVYAFKAREALNRSCVYLGKFVRILGDAEKQLDAPAFSTVLGEMPFDEPTGRHFAYLSSLPQFATRRPGPEAVAMLVAPAMAIGSAAAKPEEPVPLSSTAPARTLPRASADHFQLITGFSPDEYATLVALPRAVLVAAKAAPGGLRAWLDRRAEAEAARVAVFREQVDASFREAAE
jgi:hypothetical protein